MEQFFRRRRHLFSWRIVLRLVPDEVCPRMQVFGNRSQSDDGRREASNAAIAEQSECEDLLIKLWWSEGGQRIAPLVELRKIWIGTEKGMGHMIAQKQPDRCTAVIGSAGFVLPQSASELAGCQESDVRTSRK